MPISASFTPPENEDHQKWKRDSWCGHPVRSSLDWLLNDLPNKFTQCFQEQNQLECPIISATAKLIFISTNERCFKSWHYALSHFSNHTTLGHIHNQFLFCVNENLTWFCMVRVWDVSLLLLQSHWTFVFQNSLCQLATNWKVCAQKMTQLFLICKNEC